MKPARIHPPVVRFLAAIALFALPSASDAVIVGGTLGTGNNNTDPAVLESYLAGESMPSFAYWDNLVFVGSASGVYLGYNPSTMTGWIISAVHVGNPGTITVGGTNYSVTSSIPIGSSDILLLTIDVSSVIPTASAVTFADTTALPGEEALMFGRGFTGNTSAPYYSGGVGGASMRWGTNLVFASAPFNIGSIENPNIQPYVVTQFDDTDPTAYEAQGTYGDSGGGLFILRDGVWQLSGVAHFIYDPDLSAADPTEYGDRTGYSDIYAHLSAITLQTGTLIPEPSLALLLPAGTLFLAGRRRRH